MPVEAVYYTCITWASINSVMKIEKKNYLQVYLEGCKYKVNKKKMPEFIGVQLKSYSSSRLCSHGDPF